MPERVTPQAGMSAETYAHHLKRYEFAADMVAGKTVLSIACGTGYGEDVMAKTAASVLGVDVSDEAIAFAKAEYQRDNLEFMVGDGLAIPTEADQFDVVVSFETVEHIEADRDYLAELKRVLKPDGTLLISTPNRARTIKQYLRSKPYNPYHVREYFKDDLLALLRTQFNDVTLYGQQTILRRTWWRLPQYFWYKYTGRLAALEQKEYSVKPYPAESHLAAAYFVAVCND